MSNDNIVSFPGGQDKETKSAIVDDVLKKAMGKYSDIIIIGLTDNVSHCVTSVNLAQTIYEIARTAHRLHITVDRETGQR